MLDYSNNELEKKDFILGYSFDKKGNIIIEYADEEDRWVLPYNKNNINAILTKMKEQVIDTEQFEKNKKEEKQIFIKWAVNFFSGSIIAIILTLFTIPTVDIVCYIISSILAAGTISLFSQICHINSVLKDLERNRKFLEMEQEINDSIKNKKNALVNVSRKTKSIVRNFPSDMVCLDINSINHIPVKDLDQIMENVKRNERFGFDYTSETLQQSKSKIRKRKR